MYKKQEGLLKRSYMINQMKIVLEMKTRSHRYHINRPRPKHGHKYTNYNMSQYNDGYMYEATPKQHLKLTLPEI